MSKIILIGHGYIGRAIKQELEAQGIDHEPGARVRFRADRSFDHGAVEGTRHGSDRRP